MNENQKKQFSSDFRSEIEDMFGKDSIFIKDFIHDNRNQFHSVRNLYKRLSPEVLDQIILTILLELIVSVEKDFSPEELNHVCSILFAGLNYFGIHEKNLETFLYKKAFQNEDLELVSPMEMLQRMNYGGVEWYQSLEDHYTFVNVVDVCMYINELNELRLDMLEEMKHGKNYESDIYLLDRTLETIESVWYTEIQDCTNMNVM